VSSSAGEARPLNSAAVAPTAREYMAPKPNVGSHGLLVKPWSAPGRRQTLDGRRWAPGCDSPLPPATSGRYPFRLMSAHRDPGEGEKKPTWPVAVMTATACLLGGGMGMIWGVVFSHLLKLSRGQVEWGIPLGVGGGVLSGMLWSILVARTVLPGRAPTPPGRFRVFALAGLWGAGAWVGLTLASCGASVGIGVPNMAFLTTVLAAGAGWSLAVGVVWGLLAMAAATRMG